MDGLNEQSSTAENSAAVVISLQFHDGRQSSVSLKYDFCINQTSTCTMTVFIIVRVGRYHHLIERWRHITSSFQRRQIRHQIRQMSQCRVDGILMRKFFKL